MSVVQSKSAENFWANPTLIGVPKVSQSLGVRFPLADLDLEYFPYPKAASFTGLPLGYMLWKPVSDFLDIITRLEIVNLPGNEEILGTLLTKKCPVLDMNMREILVADGVLKSPINDHEYPLEKATQNHNFYPVIITPRY